jgi:hypothetical protein
LSPRLLVVEDQPDNRQIIRDMPAPTDYEITEAEDSEQALAAVAKARPDLILMEIQLPSMDGYEINATNPNQPCAFIDPDHRGHCLRAQRRGTKGAGGWLRRLCAQALQPTPTTGEIPQLPALAGDVNCCGALCPLLTQVGHWGHVGFRCARRR